MHTKIDPKYFHKVVGTETEHLLIFDRPKDASDYECIELRDGLAKRIVSCCKQNESVQWSYQYPHELYVFPDTVNRILNNGSRLYDEVGYVEVSTAECLDPLNLVAIEHSCTNLLASLVEEAQKEETLSNIRLVKSNLEYGSLPWSASNSCHENYSVSPELFRLITSENSSVSLRHWIPFLVTRILFAGAGCLQARIPQELREESQRHNRHRKKAVDLITAFPADNVPFQISQRADFMSSLYDLETTKFRPLVNLRDEPHADPSQYRRLHVIVGDTNRCDLSIYLKAGVTQVFLSMLECSFLTDDFELADPLQAIRIISRDLTLSKPVKLRYGGYSTALSIQSRMLAQAKLFCSIYRNDIPPYYMNVVQEWERVLNALHQNPILLKTELDWVAKFAIVQEQREQCKCEWDDPRCLVIDGLFSTISDPLFEEFQNIHLKKLVTNRRITHFTDNAPPSRAKQRVELLKSYTVREMNWDYVVTEEKGTILLPHPIGERIATE